MSPEQWIQLVREFGLPIAMFAAFGWLFLTGRIVTRRELDKWITLFEQERADRVAAQKGTADLAAGNADVAEAVANLSAKVAGNVYDERLTGRARRGS